MLAIVDPFKAAYDEYHLASVELKRQLDIDPDSEKVATIRKCIELARLRLLDVVHSQGKICLRSGKVPADATQTKKPIPRRVGGKLIPLP